MSKESPRHCPAISVSEWDAARGWQHREVDLHRMLSPELTGHGCLISTRSRICFIFSNANAIRKCERCRQYFIDAFQMPKPWWSDYSRKSNGYFGCQATHVHNSLDLSTWAYFEVKQLEEGAQYRWYKLNMFVRYTRGLSSTNQTTVLAFDTPEIIAPRFLELLATPDLNCLQDPFWFYTCLLSELARLQESAVWAIRNRVRAVEKVISPRGRPEPDYRHLHDIARHAIHVSETLDVAVQTIQRMVVRHEDLMRSTIYGDASQEVHSQLQFFQSFISSLRCRSNSNEKRMSNEIQLAFNIVAQHDASTSVKIGLATQSDSVTMKSIAFVTLTFLPPTFVSAIFSMSFFDYSVELGWVISNKFWVYWAFAVPTTVLTAIVWYFLRQYNVSALPGGDEQRPTRLFDLELLRVIR
ncbi:hypothetical protein HD806DRAFT_502519 [Xylariaceae sp. AK1471]|nr:hypothetical protein HD806DRAFT_502519 [Xylariaceae sp. AK1471]